MQVPLGSTCVSGLPLGVGRGVEADGNGGFGLAVFVVRGVLHFEVDEADGQDLGRAARFLSGSTDLVVADQRVLQRVLHVHIGAGTGAGLAQVNHDVLTGAAAGFDEQARSRAVHAPGDDQIADFGIGGFTVVLGGRRRGDAAVYAPLDAVDIHPTLVVAIGGFPFDPIVVHEDRHETSFLLISVVVERALRAPWLFYFSG